ncbi:MAG: FG-GAP-like repeat-containing protein [Candidatus Kapabacteria bacterium]|nr:FG-GAP-like repeat-containing protein [Candidatus Kapabacteria bacterium]
MKNLNGLILLFVFFIYLPLFSQEPNPAWLKLVTKDVGLDSARYTRIMAVDVNNDNYPDLILGEGKINKNRIRLYLNVENPDPNAENRRMFVDVTESSGINANRDPEKEGRIADISSMADFDNDGDMDLITSIYYHRLQMYLGELDPGDRTEVLLNDGTGKFTLKKDAGVHDIVVDDTIAVGLVNVTGIGFLDYDLDGNLDIFMSTWFTDYAAFNNVGTAMPSILLKGNGDGSFTHIKTSGIQKTVEPDYGVNITDWNNDGWQDIITSPYCRTGGVLFRNRGDGTFINYSGVADYSAQKMKGDNGQNLCQWEAQPADFDNDGDMDLLQVNVHGGYDANEGRTHVTINQGPSGNYKLVWDMERIKRDAPKNSHLGDQGGCWFDLDGDGWQDIAICQMAYPQANLEGQERLYICRQNENRSFDDISRQLGIFHLIKEAHSIEPIDFDLDGDQDLFVSHQIRDTQIVGTEKVINVYMQVQLLRNDIGNQNNWVSVKLNPPEGCNKSAIGARIYLYSEGISQIQEIQAGLGHFAGQQPFIRNFGLGKRNKIDSIVVRWPHRDMLTTKVLNPPINSIFEIDGSGNLKIIKSYLDLAEMDNFSQLTVIPNPASNYVEISGYNLFNSNQGDKPLVSVYNNIGKKVKILDRISSLPIHLDLSDLPAGIYYIQVGNKVAKIVKIQ